jgi:hypothetical protein
MRFGTSARPLLAKSWHLPHPVRNSLPSHRQPYRQLQSTLTSTTQPAQHLSTAKPHIMDTAKAPVKLVKVTRVLGRTGTQNPTSRAQRMRNSSTMWCKGARLTRYLYRFSWRCHAMPRRVHGRPDPFDYPQRQGTRYAHFLHACNHTCPQTTPC